MASRRIDRLRNICQLTAKPASSWQVPVRLPVPCSTPETVPVPQYRDVAETLTITEALRIPDALEISNADFTLHCSDLDSTGPHGAPASVEAGEVLRYLYWIDVPDIAATQLHFLASLTPELLQPLLTTDVTLDLIRQVTGLFEIQAAYVQGQLVAVLTEVQSATFQMALSRIRCVWQNAIQIVACPDPGAARTSQSVEARAAGVLNPVTVTAGTFESSSSQAEANSLAYLNATQQLTCLFGNDTLDLTCRDLGYLEDVPTDDPTAPSGPDGRARVGSVTIPADSYFANTKAQAQALARNAAQQQLSCFYINETITLRCADIDPSFEGVYETPVNYDDLQIGNPVTVPAGRILVAGINDTQATADAAARTAAQAFLVCTYKNTRQTVTCLSVLVGTVTLPPQDAEKVVVVEAGEVEADSQEEADALAVEIGRLQLNCVYCNAFIPPSCYPPSYSPVPGRAIPLSDVTPDWSLDVILGLTAGTVCMDDPQQVPAVAQAVAVQRTNPAEAGCVYVNDEMWFGCLDKLPGNPTLPRGSYHHPEYAANVPVLGYEDWDLAAQLSPFCVPAVALGAKSYLVLTAGLYSINSKDVPVGQDPKVYANAQARLFGLSLIRCTFANPEMTLDCSTAYDADRFDQSKVAQGHNEIVQVTIPRGSHESAFSFLEAIRDTKLEAQSLLACHYENPDMLVRCWDKYGQPNEFPSLVADLTTPTNRVYGTGKATRYWVASDTTYSETVDLQDWQPGSTTNPVLVPRGTFTSLVSLDAAIQQALVYAIASLDCTAQARDTNVCNDPLRIFCGSNIERHPGDPYRTGTNSSLPANTRVGPDGVTVMGNGHNYVVVKINNFATVKDLGCAEDDPVGGCGGTGLYVPSCVATGRTREEANMLAYQLMRSLLTCSGSGAIPSDTGGGGGGEGGGGAPERCPLTVYQKTDANGNPSPGEFSCTAGMVNRIDVLLGSMGGAPITNSSPPNLDLNNGTIYLGLKWTLEFDQGYLVSAQYEGSFVARTSGEVPADDPAVGNFCQKLATIEDGALIDNYTACRNYFATLRDAQGSTNGAAIAIIAA